MPNAVQLCLLGIPLVVALLALAQKFSGWKHLPTAWVLVVIAGGIFVAECLFWLSVVPSWIGWSVGVMLWSVVVWFISAKRNREEHALTTRPDGEGSGNKHPFGPVPNSSQDAPNIFIRELPSIDGGSVLSLWSDNGKTAVNAQFGALVSEDRFIGEYEFHCIPSALPPISKEAVQCKIIGVRNPDESSTTIWPDALQYDRTGTSTTVPLDYDDANGNRFSRLFTLAKNMDGSVTWIGGSVQRRGECKPPIVEPQDINWLRENLRLAGKYHTEHAAFLKTSLQLDEVLRRNRELVDAASHLQVAGKLSLLAEDASSMSEQFRMILADNVNDPWPIDLTRPFATQVMGLNLGEPDEVIPWQRRHLICFRGRYNVHRHYVTRLSLQNFASGVTQYSIPNEHLTAEAIQEMLLTHATALSERAQILTAAYDKASGS